MGGSIQKQRGEIMPPGEFRGKHRFRSKGNRFSTAVFQENSSTSMMEVVVVAAAHSMVFRAIASQEGAVHIRCELVVRICPYVHTRC